MTLETYVRIDQIQVLVCHKTCDEKTINLEANEHSDSLFVYVEVAILKL